MADFGAKGSVPGYDVKSVVDYLLQFSSSWPHLKIQQGGSASVTLNATPQTIYTHNLGYPALYFIIVNGQFDADAGLAGIGIDGTDLAYDGSGSSGSVYSFYWYICRLPLDQIFSAPQISGSTIVSTTADDYGFKVSKPGKRVDSTDMRDFSLHSSTRSLMVHQVDPGGTSLSGGYYTRSTSHNLNYVPHGFCFLKPSTNTLGLDTSRYYTIAPNRGVTTADFTITNSILSMRADSTYYTSAPSATAVILKDPFAKETVNVSFP